MVMPPAPHRKEYWALPVTRFNHMEGIAPYNGTVAIMRNSRLVSPAEADTAIFKKLSEQCVAVARLLRCTAPIRIDARRFLDRPESELAIFDVNMKPVSVNCTRKSYIELTCEEHHRPWTTRKRGSSELDGACSRGFGLGLSAAADVYTLLCEYIGGPAAPEVIAEG